MPPEVPDRLSLNKGDHPNPSLKKGGELRKLCQFVTNNFIPYVE